MFENILGGSQFAFMLKRILKGLDGIILLLLLILMIISIFCIYSATRTVPNFSQSYIKMMYFYGIGFMVLFAMLFINYKLLLRFAPVYYFIGIGLLILLFFKGDTINNAQGWFILPGGIGFQPAELCKLILILFLSYFLSKREAETLGLIKEILPMGVITFIPFLLVLMQPDLGNSIGYLVIFIVLCWFGHIHYKYAWIGLAIMILASISSLYSYITYHAQVKQFLASKHKEYWLDRVDAVLLPEQASEKATYHVKQAIKAIGSGSLKGDGYLQGTSVQSGQVPYTYSDSIFVIIGEEFGFIGASVLLFLYFLLIYRMITIALHIRSQTGIYIIGGISAMFLFQVFENIGMLIGIMPITGITLPFISYGGTSLLINMISIGFVLSIKIYDDIDVDEMIIR